MHTLHIYTREGKGKADVLSQGRRRQQQQQRKGTEVKTPDTDRDTHRNLKRD